MSFQTGLSGLNASSKNLDVIGNNIANSQTVGAKTSRVEFNAVVASALGPSGGGGTDGGIGVEVATVSQQFSQGTINITGNNLDCAVNGGGFFELTLKDGSAAYTRDGQFKLDSVGNIITNSGANVMGYPVDPITGMASSTTIQKLSVPTGAPIPAKVTSTISAEFNLDARAPLAATAPVTPIATYGTSLTGYDPQGIATPINLFFTKTGLNQWDVYDGDPVAWAAEAALVPVPATHNPTAPASVGTINFSATGAIVTPAPVITVTPYNASNGTFTSPVTIDVSKATQYGTSFAVSNLTQDGYTAGTLTGLSISEKGMLTTRYSNGQTQIAGQIALADFRNVQGLKPVGKGNWVETTTSGIPIQGMAGQGNFGIINSGALEGSNVDLTAELVAMMTAQRDYQSNAQTIKTQDQVLQTLVNLR